MSKVITGPKTAIKLTLQPLSSAVAETAAVAVATSCTPAISGLFWFSDSTGQFDQTAESAGLATDGNPTLDIARLLVEICDLPVTWTKTWTPTDSGDTGSDPGYLEDGSELVVYQLSTTRPGTLEVTAECNGESFGPILLTVLAAPVSGGGDGWTSIFGPNNWSPYGDPAPPYSWDGVKWTLPITPDSHHYLKAAGTWPIGYSPKRVRLSLTLASGSGTNSGDWTAAISSSAHYTAGVTSFKWLAVGSSYQVEIPILLIPGQKIGYLAIGTDQASDIDDVAYITNIEFHL